jgi:hypothetical protein
VRAEDIAAHFEISVRTVYRDIAALGEAGIPIMAEAGGLQSGQGLSSAAGDVHGRGSQRAVYWGKLVEQLTDASLRKQMNPRC